MINSLFELMKQRNPNSLGPDHDSLMRELLRIIHEEAITPLFQPIINAKNGKVYGYETLSRGPDSSPLHMPEPLFSAARRYNLLFALDSLCRRKAIARFQQLNLKGRLFINIDPHCLLDRDHQQGATLDALEKYGLPCDRVVIELTEQNRVEDIEALKRAVAHYRNMGFAIAMDDLSAGYSSLQIMNELRPDLIKLDKYFVRKLSSDAVAREFTRAICKLARSIDCAVIAEGIEQTIDLAAVRKLKISFAQGYLLGRPQPIPDTTRSAEHEADAVPATGQAGERNETIGALRLPIAAVPPDTRAEDVFEQLQKDPALMAIPVVDQGTVVGICERNAMLQSFSIRYGHELYGGKPVAQLMNSKPLVVDRNTPIEEVSPLITRRAPHTLYEPVVLTRKNRYVGLVYVHDILKRITEISISRAMECNPLTRLPGNITIEREVNRRLEEREAFVLCYIDLDNFKAFNDRYGYERGDAMIRLLADVLRACATEEEFVGHIGGDDFILITELQQGWSQRVQAMMDDFRRQAASLYDTEDAARGCILATDRAGRRSSFPLASLSVGAVPCPPDRFHNHLEISEVAVKLKHQAKRRSGNALQIDRRHGGTHDEATAGARLDVEAEAEPDAMAAAAS